MLGSVPSRVTKASQSSQVHVILWGLRKRRLPQKVDALPLPQPPFLIVRFKVNLKRLAVAHQVINQNAHLRCDDPLSS